MQGLHAFFFAAQGLQGLQAAFLAAHGLQGLQAFFLAAHGLQGLQAAATRITEFSFNEDWQGFFFLAAHGLQGLQAFFAAHGLQAAFLAAHGLQGLQAFFLAAHGLQGLQAAATAEPLSATKAVANVAVPATRPNAIGRTATLDNSDFLVDFISWFPSVFQTVFDLNCAGIYPRLYLTTIP